MSRDNSGVLSPLRGVGLVLAITLALAAPVWALEVTLSPPAPRQGDLVLLRVRGAPGAAAIRGTLGGQALAFFPDGAGHGALLGIDLDTPPGPRPWLVTTTQDGEPAQVARGTVTVRERAFPVQRLTLPEAMVELDPATARRALEEGAALRAVYDVVAPRLWTGPFLRPVASPDEGTGFGARRVINGKPRSPHGGVDWPAPTGTPVVAVNRGRVALVGEHFFPGRLVVLDHGLGLHTLYFHLDRIDVAAGAIVERGQQVGTVGATGRATGPHLHFGAQLGRARVDPNLLFSLPLPD